MDGNDRAVGEPTHTSLLAGVFGRISGGMRAGRNTFL